MPTHTIRLVLLAALLGGGAACGNADGPGTLVDEDLAGADLTDVDLAATDFAMISQGDGGADAAESPDAAVSTGDLAMPDPDFESSLTFTGCTPTLTNVRVVTNVVAYDSLSVVNAMAPLSGNVGVQLKTTTPRTVQISSTQRTTSMNDVVLNVYAGGTIYTNLCFSGTLGCTYNAGSMSWDNDPVSGTFKINEYNPMMGKLDVQYTNVVLQAISGTPTCTVNGTLKTRRLSQ